MVSKLSDHICIKVEISEFGFLMLLILLNHYIIIDAVMRYLHDNKGLEANKIHF